MVDYTVTKKLVQEMRDFAESQDYKLVNGEAELLAEIAMMLVKIDNFEAKYCEDIGSEPMKNYGFQDYMIKVAREHNGICGI